MIEHHMFHLADATQMTVSKVSRSISSLNNWSMHEVINGRGGSPHQRNRMAAADAAVCLFLFSPSFRCTGPPFPASLELQNNNKLLPSHSLLTSHSSHFWIFKLPFPSFEQVIPAFPLQKKKAILPSKRNCRPYTIERPLRTSSLSHYSNDLQNCVPLQVRRFSLERFSCQVR